MISVIVCSVQPMYLEQLKKNIETTIGVPYELNSYDNRIAKKGICAVYNEMAKKSTHEILCFIHEDVLFETYGWGKILINGFTKGGIDVLGIAGSKYKSAFFSGWYTGIKEFDCASIIHRNPDRDQKNYLNPKTTELLQDVVCLDGVFISCKKQTWQKTLFDEKNLTGFHFYDIDFSLRCAVDYRVAVSFEIAIIHLTSGGDFGNNWVETAIGYHRKSEQLLPFQKLNPFSIEIELKIAKANLDFLKSHKITWKNKISWVKLQKLYKYSSLYYSIVKFFLYRPLRLNNIHKMFK